MSAVRCTLPSEVMTMIPTAPPSAATSDLPADAQFWMPKDDELDEESGIGCFEDTRLIHNVPVDEARSVIEREREVVDAIDQLAVTDDDFERLAATAEFGDLDDPANGLSDEEREVLGQWVSDVPANLEGLELGVSGLIHALATVGMVPAASCRSHPEPSWSKSPVVLFAATEAGARALQPLAAEAGCVFAIDEVRPKLLVVRGSTIRNLMTLAELVLSNPHRFV